MKKNMRNISLLLTLAGLMVACNNGSGGSNPGTGYIFVSKSSPNGAMMVNGVGESWQKSGIGGIESADDICQHDAKDQTWIPESYGAFNLKWKAMIVDGTARQALPTAIDWVMKPTTNYRDIKTNLFIGTTNSQGVFNVTNGSVLNSTFGENYDWDDFSDSLYVVTGLNQMWGTEYYDNICANWTAGAVNPDNFYMSIGTPVIYLLGAESVHYDLDYHSMSGNYTSCNNHDNTREAVRLICVSQ